MVKVGRWWIIKVLLFCRCHKTFISFFSHPLLNGSEVCTALQKPNRWSDFSRILYLPGPRFLGSPEEQSLIWLFSHLLLTRSEVVGLPRSPVVELTNLVPGVHPPPAAALVSIGSDLLEDIASTQPDTFSCREMKWDLAYEMLSRVLIGIHRTRGKK